MATTVYDTIELELQNGVVVEIKPLPIKKLRKATNILNSFSEKIASEEMNELTESQVNDIFIDTLVEVVALVLEKSHKDLVSDIDEFEDILDLPTMYEIVKIATGWDFNKTDELGKALTAVDGTI